MPQIGCLGFGAGYSHLLLPVLGDHFCNSLESELSPKWIDFSLRKFPGAMPKASSFFPNVLIGRGEDWGSWEFLQPSLGLRIFPCMVATVSKVSIKVLWVTLIFKVHSSFWNRLGSRSQKLGQWNRRKRGSIHYWLDIWITQHWWLVVLFCSDHLHPLLGLKPKILSIVLKAQRLELNILFEWWLNSFHFPFTRTFTHLHSCDSSVK